MKQTILFLDQQSWLGGAQRVLEAVLGSLETEFDSIVGFPNQGPFRETLEAKGIRTLTVSIGDYRSGRKSYLEMALFAFRSVLCGFRLAALIRKRRVTLVYINGPRCLPTGVFAAWLTGRPSLFHLHLILTRKAEVFLVTRLARRVSRIVACSRAAAQSLLNADARLSEKIQVLYSPVPDQIGPVPEREQGDLSMPSRSFTLGIVGRITEVKGQHLLLNAVGKLPAETRGRLRILVVGDPAPTSKADLRYASKLRAIALQFGLQNNILWAGYQTDPGPCYSSMDVLVHPALWAEAMGLVILEARQRGVPVIAARIGGIPEIVDDGTNGLLVTPGDEDTLAQALKRFIEDKSLRKHLQEGARYGLEDRFTLKGFSSKVRTLVGNLCNLPDSNRAGKRGEGLATWK